MTERFPPDSVPGPPGPLTRIEHVRADEEQAAERDRLLVEHSPDAILLHDGVRILFANLPAVRSFGVASESEVVGRPIRDFLTPEVLAIVEPRVRAMLETGEPAPPIELPLMRLDGTRALGELLSAPLMYRGRRVIHTVIRDVTRRRAAEDELSATQVRYAELFDRVPVGLYRSTPEGRLLSVNQALVDMLGFPDHETLAATPAGDLYADPTERGAWMRQAEGTGVVEGVDVRLLHRSGAVIRARLNTRVRRGPRGEVLHYEGALQDVTASRRMEESYRLLFETTAQGVVYHDVDGVIAEANPAAEWILGVPRDDLLGSRWEDPAWRAVRSDGSPWPAEAHPSARALREGQPVRGVLMGVHNPVRGERRWIEVDTIPLFHPGDAQPYQVYATFADVTERRTAEAELRRSEQRLERALAGSGLGVWDWDVATGDVYVDDRWYRMLGYAPGEFATRYEQWIGLLHPDDLERTEAELQRHLSGEVPFYECEFRLRTKGGGWKWILDRGQVVEWDAEGRPRRAAGTHTDIEARRAAEEALRRSEERLATIFRAAPLGITLSRIRDGTLLEVNDAFAESLGYTAEELLGESALEAGLWVDPEERAGVRRELEQAGRVRGAPVRFRTRTGEVRDVLLFSELVQAPGETWALTLHQDVTDARRLEEQLRQAQKMEAVGRLAGGIAHDFNNMLTAITGHARFLLDALPADDARRADAEQIEASAGRATRLTRQLLAFSRQQVLRPRVVDLRQVVSSFQPLLARLIGEDVVLSVEGEAGACRVRVDPGQLEQVVLNLAVNARDAMPNGGRLAITMARVTLDGSDPLCGSDLPPGAYARISVSDTGTGMDPATRARVFEPFYTTKPAGKGTGLGLSTVYGIVSQSGGSVTVASEPGAGTTFTIHLPAVEAEPERVRAVDGERAARGGTETVLLVEDEPAVRALAVRVLERAGYRVHAAADGADALVLLRDLPRLDLLVTDMIMPGMGGRELAERVRVLAPAARVVYMSGYTSDELLRDGHGTHGDFLEKPFSPNQLAAFVRSALDD